MDMVDRTLALAPEQALDLARHVPRLVAAADVRTGDTVVVDLGAAGSVHLTGLALLLHVLWRRVGPDGQVALRGGSPVLRSQLQRLGVTPADCRAEVYGARTPVTLSAAARAPRVPHPRSPRPRVHGRSRTSARR